MTKRVAVIRPMSDPTLESIEPDEEGSYLSALQRLVGGDVEFFDVLFGYRPSLCVNENGIGMGLIPNRAVYATEQMADVGYISQMDFRSVVRPGDLYGILFGTIVACSYGEDGEIDDIADEEFEAVNEQFKGERSQRSGIMEVLRIQGRLPDEPRRLVDRDDR